MLLDRLNVRKETNLDVEWKSYLLPPCNTTMDRRRDPLPLSHKAVQIPPCFQGPVSNIYAHQSSRLCYLYMVSTLYRLAACSCPRRKLRCLIRSPILLIAPKWHQHFHKWHDVVHRCVMMPERGIVVFSALLQPEWPVPPAMNGGGIKEAEIMAMLMCPVRTIYLLLKKENYCHACRINFLISLLNKCHLVRTP